MDIINVMIEGFRVLRRYAASPVTWSSTDRLLCAERVMLVQQMQTEALQRAVKQIADHVACPVSFELQEPKLGVDDVPEGDEEGWDFSGLGQSTKEEKPRPTAEEIQMATAGAITDAIRTLRDHGISKSALVTLISETRNLRPTTRRLVYDAVKGMKDYDEEGHGGLI